MLVSLAVARGWLGWSIERDAELQILVDATCSMFERLTDRTFGYATDEVLTHVLESRQVLAFKRYPITSLDLVVLSSETDAATNWTTATKLVEGVDYTAFLKAGYVKFADAYRLPRFVVRSRTTGGYAATPSDVMHAILTQLRWSAQRDSVENVAVTFKNINNSGGTTLRSDSVAPLFRDAIEAYTRRVP